MVILDERLAEVLAKPLLKGAHAPDGKMCIMEAAAYIADEPWSDEPQCVCPSLRDFMISWNDALPSDAERDRLLKPLLTLIVGTRSTPEIEMRRRWMAFDWLVREHATVWMDLTPALVPHAAALRGLPKITAESIALAMPVLEAARKASYSAGDAAWAAARGAARDAAWAAAWAAAGDAAWAAAGDAARGAAGDAAWDAARAAAWDAARAAAWAALAPTVTKLQASAQGLVRRMCAVTE